MKLEHFSQDLNLHKFQFAIARTFLYAPATSAPITSEL